MAVRKMEIKNPEVMSIAIRQEIERSDESRYLVIDRKSVV